VVAVAFAGWSGWSLQQANASSAVQFGQLRDAALNAGRQSVATLTTVRRENPDADVNRWLSCTTGPLHQELVRIKATTIAQLRKASASAVGTVSSVALVTLDDSAGSAALLATVSLQITPASGSVTTERHRYKVGLTRAGVDWKVSSLSAIQVKS
jgi:Mce-associated membrane protein